MKYIVVPVVLLIPALLGLLAGRAIFRRSRIAQVLGAGLGGAATGAFFGSVSSAMATAVDPDQALLRGAGLGFVYGVAVGAILLLLLALAGRARRRG